MKDMTFIQWLPILLSLFALWVSVKTFYANRKNTLVTHEPHLASNHISNNDENIYTLQNKGNGIAFIKNIEYFIDGKETEISINDYIDEQFKGYKLIDKSITTLGKRGIMAIGEEQTLLRIKYNIEDAPEIKKIVENLKYDVLITYACAYGIKKDWSTSDDLLRISIPED